MSRRVDEQTAERVSVALLTRAAFGTGRAMNYATICGLPIPLISGVLARPLSEVRPYTTMLTPHEDRRTGARQEFADRPPGR